MTALSFRSKMPVVILLIACGLTLFFLRSAYQSGDSLTYALAARSGSADMFHPHHLIFGLAVHAFTGALAGLPIAPDVVLAGQIHNIVWAMIILLSAYGLTLSLTGRPWFALAAMLLLFTTRGLLTFTSWLEVYTPALGPLCLVAWALIAAPPGRLGPVKMSFCVLFYALAVLYHQSNVLFMLPLAAYFILSTSRRFRDWVILVACSGSVVLAAYVLAYVSIAETPSLAGFVRFCLAYLSHPSPAWGSSTNVGPSGLQGVIISQVWNIVALSSRAGKAVLALLVVAVLLWSGFQTIRKKRLAPEQAFLLVWMGAYWLFFLWWLPYQVEFFLVTAFPFVLLTVIVLNDAVAFRRVPRTAAAVVSTAALILTGAFLIVHNFPSMWAQHTDRGESYRKAHYLSRLLTPDLIVMTDYDTGANLRFYFHHDSVVETAIPQLIFYKHRVLPKDYFSIVRKRCLVELDDVVPRHTLMGFNGYTHPSEWLSWIEWLLGVTCETDGTCSFRVFLTVRDTASGKSYIVVDDKREKAGGIEEILSGLDCVTGKQGSSRPFAEWLTNRQQR